MKTYQNYLALIEVSTRVSVDTEQGDHANTKVQFLTTAENSSVNNGLKMKSTCSCCLHALPMLELNKQIRTLINLTTQTLLLFDVFIAL